MDNLMYKIGIVEDNKFIGNLINWELSQNPKYEVQWFATGEKLLEKKDYKPDLIVLDHELDSKNKLASNGLQILKKIERVPVIVMSAQTDIEVATQYIRNGVCDYVVKNSDVAGKVAKSIQEVFDYKSESERIRQLKKLKNKDLRRIMLLLLTCSFLLSFLAFN